MGRSKRGSTNLSFVVGIDKPSGMSSHDVIARMRRITGERRIGHLGTLDPEAHGVLLVCVGPATRLDAYLAHHEKTYEFELMLGAATTTDDAEGELLSAHTLDASMRERLSDADVIEQTLASFRGDISQVPPQFSAIKVNGKRSYAAARSGDQVALSARSVHISELKCLDVQTGVHDEFNADERMLWHLRARVSGGTYIRSIARDIGDMLGVGGYVRDLYRSALGVVCASECYTLDAFEAAFNAWREGHCSGEHTSGSSDLHLIDPTVLLNAPVIHLSDRLFEKVSHGAYLTLWDLSDVISDEKTWDEIMHEVCGSDSRGIVCLCYQGSIVALYRYDALRELLVSACGFSQGVVRESRSLQYA